MGLPGGAQSGAEPGEMYADAASKLYEMEQEKLESEVTVIAAVRWHRDAQRAHPHLTIFPKGRVRITASGLTLYKIDSVMDGDLDELISALAAADQARTENAK